MNTGSKGTLWSDLFRDAGNRSVLFFLFLLGAILFLANHYYPCIVDDFHYHFYAPNGIEKDALIVTFADWLAACKNEWLTFNSRTSNMLEMFFCVFFGSKGVFFSVFNSLCFLTLLLLICVCAGCRLRVLTLSCAAMLVILTCPNLFAHKFSMPYLWMSGSMNYLFPSLFLLAIFYFYRRTRKRQSWGEVAAISVTSFFVATLNEGAGLPLIAAMGLDFAILKDKRNPKQLLIIAGLVLGSLVVMLAPCKWCRLSGVSQDRDAFFYAMNMIKAFGTIPSLLPLFLAEFILFIRSRCLYLIWLRDNVVLHSFIVFSDIALAIAYPEQHGYFFMGVTSAVLCLSLVRSFLGFQIKASKCLVSVFACTALGLASFLLYFSYSCHQIECEIRGQAEAGVHDIVYTKHTSAAQRYVFRHLERGYSDMLMRACARLWQVEPFEVSFEVEK